jgi:hypothetical protein
MESGEALNQKQILDWAKQLSRALISARHKARFVDLRPGRIGIMPKSLLLFMNSAAAELGCHFQAPEQFSVPPPVGRPLKKTGDETRYQWLYDRRSDIYSMGVILHKLTAGYYPDQGRTVSDAPFSARFQGVIAKCLRTDPAGRYQSAGAMLKDLHQVKTGKADRIQTRPGRQNSFEIAAALTALFFLATYFLANFRGGLQAFRGVSRRLAPIAREDGLLQPEIDFQLQPVKFYSGSSLEKALDNPDGLDADTSDQPGASENTVFIEQWYLDQAARVRVFAGNPARPAPTDKNAALVRDAAFVDLQSLAQTASGDIYAADGIYLRLIQDGMEKMVSLLAPADLRPALVRCDRDTVYVLTQPYEIAGDPFYYLLVKEEESWSVVYRGGAFSSQIKDFTAGADGRIYCVVSQPETGQSCLAALDASSRAYTPSNGDELNNFLASAQTQEIRFLTDLPDGISSLAADAEQNIYFTDPEHGLLWKYNNADARLEEEPFAGKAYDKGFIDGNEPRFYCPARIKYAYGFLYVWDYNVVRRVRLQDGAAFTVAGDANPVWETLAPDPGGSELAGFTKSAREIVFYPSLYTDFAVGQYGVFITDPGPNRVIWEIFY